MFKNHVNIQENNSPSIWAELSYDGIMALMYQEYSSMQS